MEIIGTPKTMPTMLTVKTMPTIKATIPIISDKTLPKSLNRAPTNFHNSVTGQNITLSNINTSNAMKRL